MVNRQTSATSLSRLLQEGLLQHDGPLWVQGEHVVTRPEARNGVENFRAIFSVENFRRGSRVALHGTPNPDIMCALLAALLDGIVIVPIDENLSNIRKSQMLSISAPHAILDMNGTLDAEIDIPKISASKAATRFKPLDIDQDAEDADAPCYIFFTSGSTGVPKPVLGSRSGLAHFIEWERNLLKLTPQHRVGLLTRFSFDVVLRDILLPLTAGATSVLPMDGNAITAKSMMLWIEEQSVNVLHTVPSIAQAMLTATPDQEPVSALEHTLFAGEPLSGSLVERWRRRFPNTVVHNLYGPTETTLAKFHALVSIPAPDGIQGCGYPLPGTDFVVFSEDREELPEGEIGEVAIATPFASLGYFRPNLPPASIIREHAGRHYYLTGDMGFINAAGELHLRGRKDDQVKIMGVRLELAGIEAIMETHPAVEKAAVLVNTDKDGKKQLVGWFVAQPALLGDSSELRGFLAERCPAAGVPAKLIRCEYFALTPSGKIDKTRLPAPRSDAAQAFPQNETERVIAIAFASELNLDEVSVTSDFFALGGDSLSAMAICLELSEILSRHVEPGMFLDAPTPRKLAEFLDVHDIREVDAIPPAPPREKFALTPQQQRYLRTFCAGGNRNWCNMVTLFDLPNGVNAFDVSQAITDIASYHDSLRLTFHFDQEGEVVQRINPSPEFNFRVIDLSAVEADEIDGKLHSLKIDEGEMPIDIFSNKACFRAALLFLPNGERKLLWNVHHIISDGSSQGILAEALNEWFRDKISFRERNATLPSYKDIACYLSNRTPTDIGGHFPDMLRKPCFYRHRYLPHRQNVSDPQRCRSFENSVSGKTIRRLQFVAQNRKCTPYILLLSGYLRTLADLFRRTDICIVTPLAGRTHPQIQKVIGDFINLVPLRVHDINKMDNRELVSTVTKLVAGATKHQEEQFDRVVDEIGLPFLADRNPLTGFSLNYMPQGTPGDPHPSRHLDRGYKLKYDMLFLVRHFTNALNVEIQYRAGLFSVDCIETVFNRFEQCLNEVCHD